MRRRFSTVRFLACLLAVLAAQGCVSHPNRHAPVQGVFQWPGGNNQGGRGHWEKITAFAAGAAMGGAAAWAWRRARVKRALKRKAGRLEAKGLDKISMSRELLEDALDRLPKKGKVVSLAAWLKKRPKK